MMSVKGIYEELEQVISPYKEVLGKAADTILDEDVSNYPIFAIFHAQLDLGLPIIEGDAEDNNAWSINATTLEELAAKNVIEMARVDNFRAVYKDPKDFICLFLVEEGTAQFVFLPRE
ncbi:MAG: hypothetical protein DHS20C18_01480 [Saprospiraceae bacterium]|nr:MAG: hypothetical protein DHS20C18_01480 [Saprospiraceae bacterium]